MKIVHFTPKLPYIWVFWMKKISKNHIHSNKRPYIFSQDRLLTAIIVYFGKVVYFSWLYTFPFMIVQFTLHDRVFYFFWQSVCNSHSVFWNFIKISFSYFWNNLNFKSIYFVVVLVYSCRIRNDFHPKKSIIRRIGSLFLVLAACNNVNLNMALFGFKMIPFIREIRNTFEIHLAKNSNPKWYSLRF